MPSIVSVARRCIAVALILPSGLAVAGAPDPAALSLQEAEALALAQDPLTARFRSLAQARREQAVAEGQLPDPKLRFGLLNFPTDTFSRSQEPMTQVLLGVSQSFPKGDTLALKQRQSEVMADSDGARAQDRALAALRAVRQAWLDVFLQTTSAAIVRDSQQFFAQLESITEAQYRAGRSNQQDVLRAQLELSRLEDRYTRILAEEEGARAELAKWTGPDASRPLATAPPDLPPPVDLALLRQSLPQHPVLRAENAQIAGKRIASEIAREQYKPGWMLDLAYGNRIGSNPDGSSRADFLSAMVVLDLPLFPDKRQDRRLAASEQEAFAAAAERDDKLRELEQLLAASYARWRRLGERQVLYAERLVPEAEANAEAALRAYQSGVSEFLGLMRARIAVLDTRLEELRVRIERAKVQTQLLYLAGGEA